MQIGDIVKLDQKNRLRIPQTLMKEAGIEPNGEVIVYMDLDGGGGYIYIRSKKKYDEMKEQMKQFWEDAFPECRISKDDNGTKIVEGNDNDI